MSGIDELSATDNRVIEAMILKLQELNTARDLAKSVQGG